MLDLQGNGRTENRSRNPPAAHTKMTSGVQSNLFTHIMDNIKSTFFVKWSKWYPDTPPLGWTLREKYPDKWLRIHSLPGSKRTARTKKERSVLITRHQAVTQAIFKNNDMCTLVLAVFDLKCNDSILRDQSFHHTEKWPMQYRKTGEPIDELYSVEFYISEKRWKFDGFEEILLQVNDDKIDPIVIVNMRNGQAYSPYDGGADLFFSSKGEREKAKMKFSQWLSTRADGL